MRKWQADLRVNRFEGRRTICQFTERFGRLRSLCRRYPTKGEIEEFHCHPIFDPPVALLTARAKRICSYTFSSSIVPFIGRRARKGERIGFRKSILSKVRAACRGKPATAYA